jgi:hypothetical protein
MTTATQLPCIYIKLKKLNELNNHHKPNELNRLKNHDQSR